VALLRKEDGMGLGRKLLRTSPGSYAGQEVKDVLAPRTQKSAVQWMHAPVLTVTGREPLPCADGLWDLVDHSHNFFFVDLKEI
jgi:hypothetical protein